MGLLYIYIYIYRGSITHPGCRITNSAPRSIRRNQAASGSRCVRSRPRPRSLFFFFYRDGFFPHHYRYELGSSSNPQHRVRPAVLEFRRATALGDCGWPRASAAGVWGGRRAAAPGDYGRRRASASGVWVARIVVSGGALDSAVVDSTACYLLFGSAATGCGWRWLASAPW